MIPPPRYICFIQQSMILNDDSEHIHQVVEELLIALKMAYEFEYESGSISAGPIHRQYIDAVIEKLTQRAKDEWDLLFSAEESHMKEWVRYIAYVDLPVI
jgi:hypothetical protein